MPKVLLADDSATMQKVVDLVLRDQGYEVVSANTGEDALNIINTAPPDLVLAYIKLPGINGYELCQQIKASASTQGIPVILLAGAFDPVDESLKAQVQANGSLVKPFQAEDLLKVIGEHMGGAAMATPAIAAPAASDDIMFEGEDSAMSFAGVAEGEPAAAQPVEAESFADLAEAAPVMAEPVMEAAPVMAEPAMEAMPVEAEAVEAEAVEAEAVEAEAVEAEAVADFAEAAPVMAEPVMEAAPVAAAAPGVDSARLEAVFKQTVEAKVAEAIAAVDIKTLVINALEPHIKGVLEKIAYDSVPEFLDRILKGNITESLTAVNKELENIIWETVPDLAEEMLKKELERIRQESQ